MSTLTKTKPEFHGRFIEADNSTSKKNGIEIVGFVQMTKNYDLFKFIEGNRNVVAAHLRKVLESIKEEYLITIIIVNEFFEILDGQHRFETCKELGLPVLFIQVKGYSLKQVQRYNTNSKNWAPTDYMNSYIETGNKDYETYKEVKEAFPFNHQQLLSLVNGGIIDGKGDLRRFKAGKLKITAKKEKIFKLGRMVMDFEKYYDKYNSRAFFNACMTMFRTKGYDHQTMLKKLSMQTNKLLQSTTAEGYLRMLEEIYNYHSRGGKISFIR